MLKEAPVFGGNDGVDEMAWHEIDRDVGITAAALAQKRPVGGQHAHDRGLVLKPQRHGIGNAQGVIGKGSGNDEKGGGAEIKDGKEA